MRLKIDHYGLNMFFDKSKNSHPAATGRFATYGEIVSNFSYMPFNFKKQKRGQNHAAYKSTNITGSNILLLTLSLILSVIAVIFFNQIENQRNLNVINPALIFIEYVCMWIVLFLLLRLLGNKIKNINITRKIDANNLPDSFKNNKRAGNISYQAGLYKKDKAFNLGILRGNKKFPDLMIGLDKKMRFEHTLIVSPTGGGKTSRYIIPNIINDAKYAGLSIFTVDIDSPYLYESVKKEWMKPGKSVIHFDPYFSCEDIKQKIHFNPLIDKEGKYLSDDRLYSLSSLLFYLDKAEINGGDIHAHRYYSKRSSDVFYGCLLYLKYKYNIKYFNLITVKGFFEKGIKFIEEEIAEFNGDNNKKVKGLFNNFFELPPFERAKIITDILNTLDFLNDKNVMSSFKSNAGAGNNKPGGIDFFMENFFENDTLLIIGIPKEKINSGGAKLMSFVTNIFVNGIYESRRKRLKGDMDDNNSCNKNEPRDIFMYLDEFPALSLNNFDVELANLRKTNTGVCLTVQDIAFIKNKYGDTALITSNIGTHIVVGHASYETCKYYANMSGEKYIFHKEPVKKGVGPIGYGYESLNEVPVASGLYPLISPDEIRNMNKDSAFIYTKYLNPFILDSPLILTGNNP